MESVSKETGKLRRPMTAKRWTLCLVGAIFFVMLMIAAVNYIVDPFGYFHSFSTEDRGVRIVNGLYNFRLADYHYFKEHHSEYDGVILGGSKSMFWDESKVLAGERYCNLAAQMGNFYDYLNWTKWIAENTDIRYILLSLSTFEVEWYSPEDRNADEAGDFQPAELDYNKSKVIEFIQFLYRGGIEPSLNYFKNGSIYRNSYHGINFQYSSRDPDTLSSRYEDWTAALRDRLYRSSRGSLNSMRAIEQDLEALEEIREICADSNIQLTVVIAPASTITYLYYESPEYWDYLRDMAQIVDYWDYSMQNAFNRNQFNFIDSWHMYTEAINHVLDQRYGIEPDSGLGVYVTKDNVEEHISERQEIYDALMKEYAETGTVRQGMYFDDGYLMSEMFYPIISNTGNKRVDVHGFFKNYLNVVQHFYAGFDHLEGIGVFARGVPSNPEDLGTLKLRVYDDTGRQTIYVGDIDSSAIREDGFESFIHLGGLELIEGHWYSLIFSYEPKLGSDSFTFQYVDGESTGDIYMELDGVPQEYEVKMDIFRSQTYGNYRQKDAVLQTDRMRGEGEGETRELTERTRYTQLFTADCDMLSYIQLKTSHRDDPEEPEPADDDYSVILELRDPDGTLMSRKTIMGAVLRNADTYNVTFDGDLYLEPGETYELTIYANKATEQGLKLLTHGKEPDSVLYLNGAETGESLCYRIYGVTGADVEYRRANSYG